MVEALLKYTVKGRKAINHEWAVVHVLAST